MGDNPRSPYLRRPALKTTLAALSIVLAALCGCAANQADLSAREWRRAECNKVIDKEDRDRCMRRADDDYGARSRDGDKAPKR